MPIGFADDGRFEDCAVKGGVRRSFPLTAGEVMTFFGRFLFLPFCFEPLSWEFEGGFWDPERLSLRGVRGGVDG